MLKYSIIIPVYNTEKYLLRNFKSLKQQKYKNFEVFYIDDGSKDNSYNLLLSLTKNDKRFNVTKKENSGPSDTRNCGLEKANGDYIVFLDSDDYLDENYFKNLNSHIEKSKSDVIRITYAPVIEENTILPAKKTIEFNDSIGIEAFIKFIDLGLICDSPCFFVYSKKYWEDNKFRFEVGRFHEDFGLIPEVLIKAKSVSSISNVVYMYQIQREGSTMNNKDEKFLLKRIEDTFFFYDYLYSKLIESGFLKNREASIFKHYIENTLIARVNSCSNTNIKKYKKELRKRGIYKVDIHQNYKIIIKKIILNLNFSFYCNHIIK